MSIFSERLKELRASSGALQSEVAPMLGIKSQSYSAYETGREPNYAILCKMAKHFNVTADYLLGLSEHKNEKEHIAQNKKLAVLEEKLSNINSHERHILIRELIKSIDLVINSTVGSKDANLFTAYLAQIVLGFGSMLASTEYLNEVKSTEAYVMILQSSIMLNDTIKSLQDVLLESVLSLSKDKEEEEKINKAILRTTDTEDLKSILQRISTANTTDMKGKSYV